MSEEEKWKYAIAFSFLQQDEGLATQLNDLLQDRFRTFLYSKAQERLAGADGQQIFTDVFGSETRTVVASILHAILQAAQARARRKARCVPCNGLFVACPGPVPSTSGRYPIG